MRKSSNVHIATAVSAFILVAGLMLLPAVSKGMAMSMTAIPELSTLLKPTSTQGGGLNFAMDSAGFTQVSMQTADNMVKKGDPIHKYSLVAYETDLKLPQNVTIHAMTFNGTVPCPTVRVTQGAVICIHSYTTRVLHLSLPRSDFNGPACIFWNGWRCYN